MAKYCLHINRVIHDNGTVIIDAESKEDAERKYWEPDYSKGERIIFDDEITWSDDAVYDYYITEIEEVTE